MGRKSLLWHVCKLGARGPIGADDAEPRSVTGLRRRCTVRRVGPGASLMDALHAVAYLTERLRSGNPGCSPGDVPGLRPLSAASQSAWLDAAASVLM